MLLVDALGYVSMSIPFRVLFTFVFIAIASSFSSVFIFSAIVTRKIPKWTSMPMIKWKFCSFSLIGYQANAATLNWINAKLHLNCQVECFSFDRFEFHLFPFISLVLVKPKFVGYAMHPNAWLVDSITDAINTSRLLTIDFITEQIDVEIKRQSWLLRVIFLLLTIPLLFVDALVAMVNISVLDADVAFCSRTLKSNVDHRIHVTFAKLTVTPNFHFPTWFLDSFIHVGFSYLMK